MTNSILTKQLANLIMFFFLFAKQYPFYSYKIFRYLTPTATARLLFGIMEKLTFLFL